MVDGDIFTIKNYIMHRFNFLIIFFLVAVIASAQENVLFLNETPKINGVIDKEIYGQCLKNFTDIYKSNEDIDDIDVRYLLGHNSEYLYIYIEADANEIIYRDRGYQNGDGFHITIGKVNEDGSETDEFYVFGFSPANDWSNKMRWYYNIDLSMAILPDNVLFETAENNGIISFELLLPWTVAKPYHPWINDNIAFNLCFVKAVNENDKIFYFITTDERMQSEQSTRKYVKLNFEEVTNEGKIFALPSRLNIFENQLIEIQYAGYFKNKTKSDITVKILNEEKEEILSEKKLVNFDKGLSRKTVNLKNYSPRAGNYYIRIYTDNEFLSEYNFSVFASFDLDAVRHLLEQHKANIKSGTYNTLHFYVNELELEINNLKYYESSNAIAKQIEKISNYIKLIEENIDPFENLSGTYRRAFLSEIDNTFRPYSIYLPEDFDPEYNYPLLVYLHGSGEDDRTLFRANFIKQGFIVLAPNGRGTSNCFATNESQIDIKEAIDDVVKNFNINTNKIILSGFSMGGYGVYRTFYEYPEMFSALAIISGHPDLARNWRIEEGINFLDQDMASLFSDIPIFVYHGKKDLNCPFELTEQMVNMIRKHNPNIEFIVDENEGHSNINKENREKYHRWLNNL